MKTNRRNFIKTAGVTGSAVVTGGIISCTSNANPGADKPKIWNISKNEGKQVFNMSGYSAPKLDVLRVGYIGIGGRGLAAVKRMSLLEGVEIKALCDLHMDRVNSAQEYLKKMGMPAAKGYADGSYDLWRKMVEDEDLDLVYIATPRAQHTGQCVYSMETGAHAATEIPASATLDECWQLVETSERTKKHCSMIENCVYDFWELLILNMARQGFFGEIIHVDAAYISNQMNTNLRKDLEWRTKEFINRDGNIYPTHGLGPACQVLNINRGDRLDFITSVSSHDFTMGAEIEKRAAEDDYYKQFIGQWKLGNMNTSTIKTVNGKTLMLQYNVGNPRPGTRIHWVVGTKGIAKKQPAPSRIAQGGGWMNEVELKALEEKFTPPIVKIAGEMAKKIGGHGGMDFLMQWRLVDCLRNGLPLDMDCYDAAAWSSIVPLSEWSVANNSCPVAIPDFTRGSWKENAPLDIEMKSGGGTTAIKNTIKFDDDYF
ncbi:MAG TPA: Gfo/Idh/MocA family oxidoreductase [Mariniphaga sp.]|nr:Gfo/Idh/MocA family oxidoreductase [Mariniphaga sp.]